MQGGGLKPFSLSVLACSAAVISAPASAQRADENAAESADDAFGTSIGSESVGIYASGIVRGFSAYDAGNARIEGLYFDESGAITDLLQSGSDIRVGLAAFGYPFPAPTGIVDSKLSRIDAKKPVLSVRLSTGQFLGPDATAELAVPVTEDLGVKGVIGYFDDQYPDGASAWFLSYGSLVRWKPAKGIELTAFFSRYDYGDEEQGPVIYSSGTFLPDKVKRRNYFGQEWAEWAGHAQTYGGFAKAELGEWKLEAGLFNSRFTQDRFASSWFDNVGQDGIGREFVLSGQDQRFVSISGEARVSREFREGDRLHRVIASYRGRDVQSDFGGYVLSDLGLGAIGVQSREAEPAFAFGALTDDKVKQRSAAIGYDLRWKDVGELNLGLIRTDYRKRVAEPGTAIVSRRDKLWLWNAALAIEASDKLTLYTATTRGLEESGTAPSNAANANEALPALRTRQMEAGVRYALSPKMRLVAAAFDIRKPYFEIDSTDNVYRILGNVRHRGVEVSISGEPVKGLNLVAGALFLQPRVTGEALADGRLGRKPIGRTSTLIDINFDYRFPNFHPLSVDIGLQYEGRRVANVDNTLSIPARTTIDVGARYRFKIGNSSATLRLAATNITNVYGWRVFSGSAFKANAPRTANLSITADI